MKTINAITELGIVNVNVKKNFEFEGYNFAVCMLPFKKYGHNDDIGFLQKLVEVRTGQQIAMFKQTKNTIKDFVLKSEETLAELVKSISIKEFKSTIDKQLTLN